MSPQKNKALIITAIIASFGVSLFNILRYLQGSSSLFGVLALQLATLSALSFGLFLVNVFIGALVLCYTLSRYPALKSLKSRIVTFTLSYAGLWLAYVVINSTLMQPHIHDSSISFGGVALSIGVYATFSATILGIGSFSTHQNAKHWQSALLCVGYILIIYFIGVNLLQNQLLQSMNNQLTSEKIGQQKKQQQVLNTERHNYLILRKEKYNLKQRFAQSEQDNSDCPCLSSIYDLNGKEVRIDESRKGHNTTSTGTEKRFIETGRGRIEVLELGPYEPRFVTYFKNDAYLVRITIPQELGTEQLTILINDLLAAEPSSIPLLNNTQF